MRRILAFLLLVSAAAATVQFFNVPSSVDPGSSFSFVVNVYNDSGSNYVQGDTVTVQVYKSGSSSTDINCSAQGPTDSGGNVTVLCDVSPNAYNVSYTLNATSSLLSENNSNTTTANVSTVTLTVSSNVSSAYPGEGITFTVNVTNSTGGPVSGMILNPSLPCSGSADTNSSGQASFSCTIQEGAAAGTWTFNVTSNSGQGSTSYTVLEKWQNPAVSSTTPSNLEKGQNNTNVLNITVTNKINAAHNYTVSLSCNDSRLVPSASPGVVLTSSYNSTGTFSISINVSADVPAADYTCTYNVSCVENQSYYNYSSFTVTVNPYHNFTLGTDNDTKQVIPGESVSFTLQVNNTGEQTDTYSAACSVNDSAYSCSLDTASFSIANGSSRNITVTVSAPKDSDKNPRTVTVNITDSHGLMKQKNFTVQPGNAYYPELSSNVTGNKSYASPGHTARATVYVKNIGNTNTTYNITVTYTGQSGWNLSGYSNGTSFNSSTSFLLNVSSGSNKTIELNVSIPSTAAYGQSSSVTIQVVSENSSSQNASITIYFKTPAYQFDVRITYNSTHLNASLWNVTLEGEVQSGNWSWALYYPNGTSALSGSGNFSGSELKFITDKDVSNWPAGVYSLNATFNSSKGEEPYHGEFVLARGIYILLESRSGQLSGSTSYCLGTRKNVTVVSYLKDVSSVSVTPTVYSSPSGISCSILSSASPYTFECYFGVGRSAYNLTAEASYSNCAKANLTCTVVPALEAVSNTFTDIGVVLCSQQETQEDTQQQQTNTADQSSGSSSASAQETEETAANSSLNISLGTALKVSGKDQITLLIKNTGNVSGNLTVSVKEEGEWEHFKFDFEKEVEVDAKNAVSYKFNYSVLPGTPPGTYNVTIEVQGEKKTIQIVVPEPNNTKIVNRYYVRSRTENKTKIILYVRNTYKETRTFNITETIPKTVAQNISEVEIITNESYKVVNPDPVIVWTVTLGPSESKTIEYVVKKRIDNISVFTDPVVAEVGKTNVQEEEKPPVAPAAYNATGIIISVAIALMLAWMVFSYLYMEPFYKPVIDQALEKVGIKKKRRMARKRPLKKKPRVEIPWFKKKAKQIVEKAEEVKEEVVSEYEVKPEAKPEDKESVEDLLDWIKK